MSGESWKEFTLQYKYAEIPEESRYVKKKKKKIVKKSNHKHQYAECIFDSGIPLGKWEGRYCTICGRIENMTIGHNIQLTDDKPIFKAGLFDKYVQLGTNES